MDLNELVTKLSNIQKKALKDSIQAKINEGYNIDELEVTYDTKINTNSKNIKMVITYEIR